MAEFLRQRLASLASLRVTVVLLAIAMTLIFASTWALIDQGMASVVSQYYRSMIVWIDFQIFLPRDWGVPGAVPWPGGYLLGALLVMNLLAAHALRFRITLKRSGILMIHAAVVLFLVGEAVTAFFASESQMPMYEGETLHWSQDIQEVELAVVDHGDADLDRVTVVPQSRLIEAARHGGTIRQSEDLPFDLQIVRWIRNARLVPSRPMQEGNPATTGIGLHTSAESLPEASGVEGGGVNLPAAWVRLSRDGDDLGTYLLSPSLQPEDEPYKPVEQQVFVEGRALALTLRFRRIYHDFAITLEDFRHDKYTGSTVAKNFSSDVQVVDAATGDQRSAHIAMNTPLRYRGTTFYQSGYIPPDRGTVLQVMHNPGMPIPYIAFAMAACGLLYHFGWMLVAYAARESRRQPAVDALPAKGTAGFYFAWIAPWAAFAVMVLNALPTAPDSDYALRAYGALPVSYKGRVKPMDTIARDMLLMLNGRQRLEHEQRDVPPIQWLADVLGNRPESRQYRVFLVQHPEVRALLGVQTRDEKRLSFDDVHPHLATLSREAERADRVPKRLRDSYDTKVLQLANRLLLFLKLRSHDDLYLVPPSTDSDNWRTLQEAAHAPDEASDDAITSYARVQQAYGRVAITDFNQAVVEHAAFMADRVPGAWKRAHFETRFNAYDPFYLAQLLYLAVVVLMGASWFGGRKPLATAAYRVMAVTFLLHTAGLVARIVLSGRPPVTNLYSSAVFIGWGCILFCLVLERIHRSGLLTLLGSTAGFLTLMVAAALAGDGDTMAVLVAVLDTNFWLATHVVIVTLGYSATFLAGLIGTAFILGGLLTPWIKAADARRLAQVLYGVIAFALVFSLVGTVLGGIWADQSWGRFWGWDPKENGALLIVLWNAMILHARWGGLIRLRGIAAMAVFGNVVTSWSWFGTNMLGVGLHSYGFIDSAVLWLALFIGSQLLLLGAAAVPMRRWRSVDLRGASDADRHPASPSAGGAAHGSG